jgi:hypothetical protein
MPKQASYARLTARGAVMLAAIVCGLAGCKGSHGPTRLTSLSNQRVSARPKVPQDLKYRNESGSPIAPVVVPDDPLPTQVQPVAAGQGGGSRATLNGDPNGITRDTLNRSIQGAMGAFAACFSSLTQDPMVSVSFEADPSGKPSLVRVGGAPPDAERCLRNVAQGIRFPSFEGKGVQVDLPLSFHRVARPTQAAPAGGQPPGATPLFLEP